MGDMSRRLRNLISLLAAVLVLAACAFGAAKLPARSAGVVEQPHQVAQFSTAALGEPHPLTWQPWILSRLNRRTDYRVVDLDARRVLEARSEKAASGILQEVDMNPGATPYLKWEWRVSQLLEGADLTRRGTDDSPVRLFVSFDGDIEKLDVEDRAMAGMVKLFSGRSMPYATLMYVWDNKLPVDTFLDNAHSGRAKMVVVESGPARVGSWTSYSRNLVADYQKAFGEAPGRIISVGVMTDSNRTEIDVTSYYGDINLSATP